MKITSFELYIKKKITIYNIIIEDKGKIGVKNFIGNGNLSKII